MHTLQFSPEFYELNMTMNETGIWTQIGIALIAVGMLYYIYRSRGGIKALFERSQQAPQHWGLFAVIMLVVIAFVYLLIKL